MEGFRGFSVSNDLSNHYYIAKSQAAFLTKLKNELISRVCDFAENYKFIVPNKIQSFYWNKIQVTFHPMFDM